MKQIDPGSGRTAARHVGARRRLCDQVGRRQDDAGRESSLQPKTAIGLDDSMIHNAMLIDWPGKNEASAEPASLDVKAMDEPKLIQAAAQPVEPLPATAPKRWPIEADAAASRDPEPMPADSAGPTRRAARRR